MLQLFQAFLHSPEIGVVIGQLKTSKTNTAATVRFKKLTGHLFGKTHKFNQGGNLGSFAVFFEFSDCVIGFLHLGLDLFRLLDLNLQRFHRVRVTGHNRPKFRAEFFGDRCKRSFAKLDKLRKAPVFRGIPFLVSSRRKVCRSRYRPAQAARLRA